MHTHDYQNAVRDDDPNDDKITDCKHGEGFRSVLFARNGCVACELESAKMDLVRAEERFHRLMDALRRSRMEHGDCKSGNRYDGIPKACTACMAIRQLDQALAKYKGRTIRLA